jgi:WD40 repeat protein
MRLLNAITVPLSRILKFFVRTRSQKISHNGGIAFLDGDETESAIAKKTEMLSFCLRSDCWAIWKGVSTSVLILLCFAALNEDVVFCSLPQASDKLLRPELVLQTGHSDLVTSLAISPNGRWMATGGFDKTIILWEAATGYQLLTLTGHDARVQSISFSLDGRWLASGSDDKTIKIWDAVTFREVTTISGHHGSVQCLAFSPDGRWLASGGADTSIMLWEVGTWHLRRTLGGHKGSVRSLAFSSNGRWLVSGSADKVAKIWEVSTVHL